MSTTNTISDIPSRTIFSYDRPTATLTLTIPGGCGFPEEKKECFYDVTSKSWKTKITTSYKKENAPDLTENEFKAQCTTITRDENGCSQVKDCVLGSFTKQGDCASSTDPVKLKYPITQNPSSSGKSCVDVAKSIDNNTTATIIKEGEFINVNKKCSELSSSSSGKTMIIVSSVGVMLLVIVIIMFRMKKKR